MSTTYASCGALLSTILFLGCGEEAQTCDASCNASGGSGGESTSAASGGQGGTSPTGGENAGGGLTTGGSGGQGGAPAWVVPTCTTITGTDAVTFTKDEGATLTPTAGTLQGIGYTSVAALDTPNVLLAEHKGTLLRSNDAGCTWTTVGMLQGGPFKLTAAKGGRAYAWVDNGASFYRIDGGTPTLVTSPAPNVLGIGVDPNDGLHVRAGDSTGALYDSVDGGTTWAKQGTPATTGSEVLGYRVAFDPANLDHVLFGQASVGARVTTDGGANWATSLGLGAQGANAFSVAISPADGQYVWIEGLELGPDLRHLYLSTDGGLNFVDVVDDSATIELINGNLIAPHPTDKNVLYFVFGTYFQGYGTDLYRYDHAQPGVTTTHNAYDEISSIVASPADPSVLYLGLTVEEI